MTPFATERKASLRENARFRDLVFALYVLVVARYLWWRVTTWNAVPQSTAQLAYSVFWAAAETLLIVSTLRLVELLRSRIDRSKDVEPGLRWWATRPDPPLIDILIPTCNEPLHVLEKSIAGAQQQTHARTRVWVLDDGDRAEVRALAATFGVGYLARKDRAGAKAGNLNNAVRALLSRPDPPDFISVIDSDFVAQKPFLSRTLALMVDDRVGLVQTPQFFFNPDPIQAAFPEGNPITDNFRLTHDTINWALDARGAAYCRGTSFLIRVAALRDIGLFPTTSVCEGVYTSQRLRVHGWKTVHLDEQLSFGLATENLAQLTGQLRRFATGFAQVARVEWATRQGRSLLRRLAIVEAQLRWPYTVLLQVLLFFAPAGYWFFGLAPQPGTSAQLLSYGAPVVLLFRGYLTWLSEGRSLPLFREAGTLAAAPATIAGAWNGLFRPRGQKFKVTDKGLRRGGRVINGNVFLWLLLVFAGTAGAACWRLVTAATLGTPHGSMDLAMGIWSAYVGAVALLGMYICVERRDQRGEMRFDGRNEPVTLSLGERQARGTLRDISCTGACIWSADVAVSAGTEVRIQLKGVGWLEARAVGPRGPGQFAVALASDRATRARLIREIYSHRFVTSTVRGSLLGALRAALLRPLRAARGVLFGGHYPGVR
jgi:cellulose synthase (UDP-forming)